MKWRIYALDSQVRREELISSASEVGPCRNHRVNSLTRRLEINLVKVVTKISKSTLRVGPSCLAHSFLVFEGRR